MKIMLANVAIAVEGDEFTKNILAKKWRQNFDLVKKPDTEIVSRFSDWGVIGMEGFFYPAIDMLNAQAVLQACLTAEKNGYKGILITCFGDPLLDQIRSMVDIPVASIGESAFRTAVLMGKKFGLITISQANIYEANHTIKKYGYEDYCAGIAATVEKPEEQPRALIDAGNAIEGFVRVGRQLIEQGAEILIPGCGLMSPALRLAPGQEAKYPNGLTEVDGVPVLDVMSIGIQTIEMLVALKNAGSSWISRKGVYKMPDASALESGKMVINDGRQHFWDLSL